MQKIMLFFSKMRYFMEKYAKEHRKKFLEIFSILGRKRLTTMFHES